MTSDESVTKKYLSDLPGKTIAETPNIAGKNEPNNDAENLAENTGFILKFISSHNNTSFSEEGLFYNVAGGGDNRKVFLAMINDLVNQGYYIENFDVQQIEAYLLNPSAFGGENSNIRIGTQIQKMDFDEVRKYSVGIIRDKAGIMYEYAPNRPIKANRDFFLAALWANGIRAGFQMQEIEQLIAEKGQSTKKFLIAKQIDAIPSKDANANIIPAEIAPQKQIKAASENTKVDLHEYEASFPVITPEKVHITQLAKKIPMEMGKEGVEIDGKIITVTTPKDATIQQFLGTGVYIKNENGIECIVAEKTGFVSFDGKTKKISITDEINNPLAVGPHIGNVHETSVSIFNQHHNVNRGYSLNANNISMSQGEVNGEIHSITGNIILSENTRVNGGHIIADNGNFQTLGLVRDGSMIKILSGEGVIPYVENSIVIGHKLTIGEAIGCTIIGDGIYVEKSCSTNFFGKKIHIHHMDFEFADPDYSTNCIVYVYEDIIARKIKQKIIALQKNIEFLKEKLAELNKILIQDGWENKKVELKRKIEAKSPLSEDEQMLFKKVSQYIKIKTQKTKKETQLGDLLDKHLQIEEALEYAETINKEDVGITIDKITYPPHIAEIISKRRSENIPTVFRSLNIEFYSSPEIRYLQDLKNGTKEDEKIFIDTANQRAMGGVLRADPRTHKFISDISSSGSIHLEYDEIKTYIEQKRLSMKSSTSVKNANEKIEREERVEIFSIENMLHARENPELLNAPLSIPVNIDGHYRAYIRNFNVGGIGLVMDCLNQENVPIFEVFEELSISFTINKQIHKLIVVLTNVHETEDGIIRMGGYYINTVGDISNSLARTKDFLEINRRRLSEKKENL